MSASTEHADDVRDSLRRQTLLDAAGLDDADLTDDLEPIVRWLVGWDRHTVDAVAALLTATRKATREDDS